MRRHRASLFCFTSIVLSCLLWSGCGGSGNSSPSAAVINLAGNWQASTVSKLGYNTSLAGTLAQTGNQISGTMSISGSPCATSGSLTGTVTGLDLSLSLTEGVQSVSLSGTASADGNSISGTYQAPTGGCTNGDSGTFTATRITSAAGCTPVPPGVVSWWRGEGDASDQEGSNPGVLQGGVTFGAGEVGQAFYLDGSSGYIDVPNSSSLQAIATTVSVELWAKPQALPAGQSAYLYARRDPLSSENFSVYILSDGTLNVLLRTTTSPTQTGSKFASAPGAVTFGQMQHIAATADLTSSAVSAYVNGVNVPLTVVYGPATLGGTFSPVSSLYLGRREDAGLEGQAAAAYFPGVLDEVSLYSTALTQNQIISIVNAGSAGKCQ